MKELLPTLVNDIYDTYISREREEPRRRHLGASSLGEKCLRHIYYEFRWYNSSVMGGRILRLFTTGKLEEARVVGDLKSVGIVVSDAQNQLRDVSGHIGGSVDGVVQYGDDEPHILEIKTHSDKNFKKFEKQNVMNAYPKHYTQVQMYMGLSGIKNTLYAGVNKNTDELYFEVIPFDEEEYELATEKARNVVLASAPPPRIKDIPGWFECKMCRFYNICHLQEKPARNCRTCKHSKPLKGGKWSCALLDKELSLEEQLAGCDEYILNG